MELEDKEELYHSLGRAELLPTTVSTSVLRDTWDKRPVRNIGSAVYSQSGEKLIINNAGNRPLRLCRSCQPLPDDVILGFARNDGSITVHKEGCPRIPFDPLADRTLKLDWGTEEDCEVRLFTVKVEVYDRPGLLFEITNLIQSEQINLPTVHAETDDGLAVVLLDMEVVRPRQFVRVLHRIQALVNVFSVVSLPSPYRASNIEEFALEDLPTYP